MPPPPPLPHSAPTLLLVGALQRALQPIDLPFPDLQRALYGLSPTPPPTVSAPTQEVGTTPVPSPPPPPPPQPTVAPTPAPTIPAPTTQPTPTYTPMPTQPPTLAPSEVWWNHTSHNREESSDASVDSSKSATSSRPVASVLWIVGLVFLGYSGLHLIFPHVVRMIIGDD